MRAAPKIMCPFPLCWPMRSEVDVGGIDGDIYV